MEIQEETINGITVLTLDGEVDSSTALSLQEAVEAYINPHCRILMNLDGVGYMSSAGLRVMLVTYRDVI
ncbi:MAG: STAS domain-containing protein, partial [Anaerolineae bacterium]